MEITNILSCRHHKKWINHCAGCNKNDGFVCMIITKKDGMGKFGKIDVEKQVYSIR